MAERFIGRVNQTLAFVRFSLESLDQERHAPAIKPLRLRALRESSLSHLHSVFRAYLGEISERYRLPLSEYTIASLNIVLERTGQVIPEAREINTLLETPESWLSEMMKASSEIDQPITVNPPANELASEISITSLPTRKTFDERLDEGLPLWYAEMSELVQRHRSITQEW